MSDRVLAFERRADPEGRWIPMAVRMKLDLAGLRIKLAHWQSIAEDARERLLACPAEDADDVARFQQDLRAALAAAGQPEPVALPRETAARIVGWKDPGPARAEVQSSLEAIGRRDLWAGLDRFGRYVVCALARKGDRDKLASAVAEIS